MFFDDINQIPKLVQHTGCTVFVIPPETDLPLKNALRLSPTDNKTTKLITVEQVREFIALSNNKEVHDRYFIISPADAMNEAAQNAFLKTLEEPKPFCHFVLLTKQPSTLLPTILSRAQVFSLKVEKLLDHAPPTDAKNVTFAKQLIAASPRNLPSIAIEITKNKTKACEQALDIVATAIELLYKSYFKTKNPKFLTKLPNFITLHKNLSANGHVKLHIVADLI